MVAKEEKGREGGGQAEERKEEESEEEEEEATWVLISPSRAQPTPTVYLHLTTVSVPLASWDRNQVFNS